MAENARLRMWPIVLGRGGTYGDYGGFLRWLTAPQTTLQQLRDFHDFTPNNPRVGDPPTRGKSEGGI